jgi:hypothetical protein
MLEPQSLLFIAKPFLGYAEAAASKCAPSFHMRPMRTASFLATATRAAVMGWTAPRRHQECQDGCCHRPI